MEAKNFAGQEKSPVRQAQQIALMKHNNRGIIYYETWSMEGSRTRQAKEEFSLAEPR